MLQPVQAALHLPVLFTVAAAMLVLVAVAVEVVQLSILMLQPYPGLNPIPLVLVRLVPTARAAQA
jgi:hypothetical protein